MSSSIRSVIEKNRFKGSDEIIRKALRFIVRRIWKIP